MARVSVGEANLLALAGLTACRTGDQCEVLDIGNGNPWAFAAAVALAERLARRVDELGGDSQALLDAIYLNAVRSEAEPVA